MSYLQIPINDSIFLTLAPSTENDPPRIILHSTQTEEKFTLPLDAVLPLRDSLATAAARLAEIEVKGKQQRN